MEDFFEMEAIAIKYHQFFYELLPDWFLYPYTDHIYAREIIGFALYGAPNYDKYKGDTNTYSSSFEEYNKDECETISKIYKKIIKCNKGNDHIQVGVIYNVIFNHNHPRSFTNSSDKKSNDVVVFPIFKLKLNDTILYIDNCARVYNNWQGYVENNTLPKCMMVLPKDGIYQCNPHSTVTRWSSTVWIQILQSPACDIAKTVLKVTDVTSSIIGIGSAVGLGMASLFTPIGPILSGAGLVSCAVSGGWNIGRSVGTLIDRNKHKESISPADGNALAAYFGIASSALAIGTNGGTMLLSKAIARGSSISNAAKIAYNSLLISNLTVSGLGIAYEGYRLIDQYRTQKEINIVDMMMFSSHVLFFSNSLINAKLAGQLLGKSNGTVLEKLKNFLRCDRFEKEYTKISGGNKGSKEIIHNFRRIFNETDFLKTFNKIARNESFQSLFINGAVLLNGITLTDPFIVAQELLINGITVLKPESSSLSKKIVNELLTLVKNLHKQFYPQSTSETQSCNVEQFDSIFNEMAFMNDPKSILTMIFIVATKVMQCNSDPESFVIDAVKFLWEYSKANLREIATEACTPLKGCSVLYDLLTKIIINLFDYADKLICDLHLAFSSYMVNDAKIV